ncbi:MAG: transposase, partial [Bacteroidetes bacterium]|nr:transposase [Bacteroidota bacterium]
MIRKSLNAIKAEKFPWMLEVTKVAPQQAISKRANRWYAAVSVETNSLPHERKNHGSVGVDLGVKALATLSDGSTVIGAKAHSKLLSKLQRLSRQLSKKVLRSKNFTKAKTRLSILHARIRNIRIDALHKLTTHLVLNNTKISIEDLNVKGMLANSKLSRHIMDQSFYEFRRQLNYKSSWYGSELVIVDRFY